jgi:hypothetical protein
MILYLRNFMKMVDIHMIDRGSYPEAARQRELIQHPLVQFQEGVYVLDNIREARYLSYSKGTCPYVSWIDDDDEVLDISWLDEAIEILESNPKISAVYPRYVIYEHGKVRETLPIQDPWNKNLHRKSCPVAHHLTIMRREQVMAIQELYKDHPKMNRMPDMILTQTLLRYGVLHPISNIAYKWILRDNSSRLTNDGKAVNHWANQFTCETYRLHSLLT